MRLAARSARRLWQRLRFRLWLTHLQLEVRRMGGRLVVNAPYGASFDSAPAIKIYPGGTGTLTLRLGKDVRLGREMTIEAWTSGDSLFAVGDGTRFLNGIRVLLRPGSLVAGERCLVSDGVWLKVDGHLRIGDDVLIRQYSAIHCTHRVDVEDLVALGERVSIIDSNHGADGSDAYWARQPLSLGTVVVRRNALVSAGSVILRGAVIGRNSVVGANSVVTEGEHPEGSLLAGAPARVLRKLPGAEPGGGDSRDRDSAA